ncbi:RNA dependent RNA polymerase-domain-containing protein [Thelonectria olida]|uniref:RNA-dependent RNA polymerase n=1 Tax=Thelonectria olida TaxID=1576542 RepID=A0A9P8W0G3_9HYPO|nr:RNA dependent RNA polymerase-domain-containing protein [Thelonectria olida]
MEVTLRNIPASLTSETLEEALSEHMAKLSIKTYTCDKPRRRNMGWVTFLDLADARKFLHKHEKLKGSRGQAEGKNPTTDGLPKGRRGKDIARLYVLRTPVFVEPSNRPMNPHTISHLKLKRDKKTERANKGKTDVKVRAKPFVIVAIACGQNVFDGQAKSLTFVERTAIPKLSLCTLMFGHNLVKVIMVEDGLLARLEFENRTIHDVVVDEEKNSLSLILTEPPKMYLNVNIAESPISWQRVRSIPFWTSHWEHIQAAMVYRFTWARPTELKECIRLLRQRDSLTWTQTQLPVKLNHQIPARRDLFNSMTKTFLKDEKLPFALLFQVEALVRNGYLQPDEARNLLDLMYRVSLDSREKGVTFPVTTHAMKQLFHQMPVVVGPGTDPASYDFVDLLTEVMNAEFEARMENPQRDRIYGPTISTHQAWVFKAMVTPTRILLSGPEAESKNRVLRMFSDFNDYFLRVSFYDEDGQDLGFRPQVSNEAMFARYKSVLRNGIKIAGRAFEFLGFSHSSLRSHSVWFVAPFVDNNGVRQDCTSILQSLGDFQNIRVPAKCAARMGQSFSETPYAVQLEECGIDICNIPDVKAGDRVFSDGVGTISWDALEEIWPHLPMQAGLPTCLQIRLGGYKGMLSLDSRLNDKLICLRSESMMKFPTDDLKELGICDTSCKPLRLMLNRQMIKILEDMGTKNQWFFDMQSKALDVLRNVTANTTNTKDFLERQDIGTNMSFPKFLAQLDRMGIDHRRDWFMKSVVEHVVLRELRLLKHKARIPIDEGVTLFGIMDETGFLEEDEVFVTYDRTFSRSGRRVNGTLTDGPVIVTRSPALHPGDVRVVKMKTPPRGHDLLNLQNCIVFSQKGKRDLPSQLSGGDLDGDLYNIIWERGAMPNKMFSPADYPRVTPQSLDRPVTRADIAEFFISFMKTDLLGVIATRHVILADAKEQGTLDPACVRLAELHSTAVDFSKTGIPVEFAQLPRAPQYRPDFLAMAPPLTLADAGQIDHIMDSDDEQDDDDGLGGAKHKYYRSEKILGHLYRNVDEKKIWHDNVKSIIAAGGPSVWDVLLTTVQAKIRQYDLDINWERKSAEAWKLRSHYDSSIQGLRKDFSENPKDWLTEVEVFCGFILNKKGGQTRRQRDSSIKLKEEIDRVITWMVNLMRGLGREQDTESIQSGVHRGREAIIELCWACVAVGCIQNPDASLLYPGNAKLQSFRVVAACCLVRELNTLVKNMEAASGGGYVGVGRGRRGRGRTMNLPIR